MPYGGAWFVSCCVCALSCQLFLNSFAVKMGNCSNRTMGTVTIRVRNEKIVVNHTVEFPINTIKRYGYEEPNMLTFSTYSNTCYCFCTPKARKIFLRLHKVKELQLEPVRKAIVAGYK